MPFYISWCSGLDNINSHWKKKVNVFENIPHLMLIIYIYSAEQIEAYSSLHAGKCVHSHRVRASLKETILTSQPSSHPPFSRQPLSSHRHCFLKPITVPYCFHQKLILGAKEGTQLAMCLIFKHEDPHKKQTTRKNGHGSLWPWYWGEKDRQSLGLTGWPI